MKHIVVGTAGHIDHGKSSLVLALTGTDPDRLKEEKERGITIDLGFAHWTEGDVHIALVDVPGHERFVRNMLAGVGGIDGVLLVVAADEAVMPQTREHFEICRLLGVARGVVAITKADLADHDTLEVTRLEIADLVKGSTLEDAPVIAVSSKTGAGLPALTDALRLLAAQAPERNSSGPSRLPIDRAFSMRGFGTVVTGTLVSGRVSLEEELSLLPGDRRVKVRGIQVHGARQTDAMAGQRVALNLGGIEVSEVARGQVLVAPGTFEATRALDAEITLLAGARGLRHGTRVRVHHGSAEVLGRVGLAIGCPNDTLSPGHSWFARLRLEQPLVITRGDRFVLRAYSPPATIGGGVALDPQAPRGGLRQTTSRTRFEALVPDPARGSAADDRALAAMIEGRGVTGLPHADLTARAAVAPIDIPETAQRLVDAGLGDDIGGVLFAPALRGRLAASLARLVSGFHDEHPLSEGLPREEAREKLFSRTPLVLFERVLADLAEGGTVVGRDRLALSGREVSLSADESRARDGLVVVLREAGLKPPDASVLPAAVGLPADLVNRVLSLLVRHRTLARLEGMYFHQEALDGLKRDVRLLKEERAEVTLDVAAFKERYGITRKYAIPLLEYLDRERITRRVGDRRLVL
jgi:selenocysteine-specific elongation factor